MSSESITFPVNKNIYFVFVKHNHTWWVVKDLRTFLIRGLISEFVLPDLILICSIVSRCILSVDKTNHTEEYI